MCMRAITISYFNTLTTGFSYRHRCRYCGQHRCSSVIIRRLAEQ